jgi:hypothetical protein
MPTHKAGPAGRKYLKLHSRNSRGVSTTSMPEAFANGSFLAAAAAPGSSHCRLTRPSCLRWAGGLLRLHNPSGMPGASQRDALVGVTDFAEVLRRARTDHQRLSRSEGGRRLWQAACFVLGGCGGR